MELIEIAGRSLVVYAATLVGLRLGGGRELGQLTPFDLVVILLIANAVQNAMVGPDTRSRMAECVGTTSLVHAHLVRAAKGISRRASPWVSAPRRRTQGHGLEVLRESVELGEVVDLDTRAWRRGQRCTVAVQQPPHAAVCCAGFRPGGRGGRRRGTAELPPRGLRGCGARRLPTRPSSGPLPALQGERLRADEVGPRNTRRSGASYLG
jgi:hypothetical protein